MESLAEKISSYNLFNYFFPGIVFVIMADKLNLYHFIQENLIVGAFLYYFIGLAFYCFGSLVVHPLLKKLSFVKFAKYRDFLSALNKDPKIETLSEISSMYRTLFSVFLVILILKIYSSFEVKIICLGENIGIYVLLFSFILLFLFSHKKQSDFITERIETNNKV